MLAFTVNFYLFRKMSHKCSSNECRRLREEELDEMQEKLDAAESKRDELQAIIDGLSNGEKLKLYCRICGKSQCQPSASDRHLATLVS